jgi:DNA-binding transcriptional LysR family regulator
VIVEIPDKPAQFKLHELRCFDAVVRLGSFQAAAEALGRTHPSVFAAVSKLEEWLDLVLLDRSGYRVTLTEAGRMFHARAAVSLQEVDKLGAYARQLAGGEEPVIRVVLGDLCPRSLILPILSSFFADRDRTRLHLDYEAVGGPAERLREGTADLAFHRSNDSDAGLEQIVLGEVPLVPVAAPGFLPFEVESVTPDQLRPFTQCVIRDTARDSAEEHFLIHGAHRCSVADHAMKKELILHRMGWGHLPGFMIEEELRTGALQSLQGRHLPGRVERLAALRRRDRLHGPVAEALWQHLTSFANDGTKLNAL